MFDMGTGISSPLWPPGIINNGSVIKNPSLLKDSVINKGSKLTVVSLNCFLLKKQLKQIDVSTYIISRNDNMVKPHDLLVLLG